MDKLRDKILDQIKQEEIKPIPRHIFLMKNIGLWALTIFSIISGSLSVSLLTYNFASKDWDIYHHLNESLFGFIISSLPYIWIATVLISLLIAISNIEHTKNGYKYSPLKITLSSILITIFLGSVGYFLALGQKVDAYLGSKFPTYQTVEAEKEAVWSQPDKGLFSGEIKSVDQSSEKMQIEDFNGKDWQVDYSEAQIKPKAKIEEKSEIKIIGESDGSNISASEIRPWQSGGASSGQGHGSGQGQHRNGQPSE